MMSSVPMTLEQIVEATKQLPREQVAELVDHLTLSLHHAMDLTVEGAWKTEVTRRIKEIQNDQVQGIPGEEVSARIRQITGR